jgi:HSP20 family molecular chaperone IbpA
MGESNQNHPIQEEEPIVPLKIKNNPSNLVWVDAYHIGQIIEEHLSHRHHYHLKFLLLGAQRKSIKLQVLHDRLRLMAQKTDKEWYYSEYLFKHSLKPEQTHTQFRNGLLLVDIPFDCKDQYLGVEPIAIN